MPSAKSKLLIIGAHPDDADYSAGGTAALFCQAGAQVMMVSMTNGNAGHHLCSGKELADRRRLEAEAAARLIGASYEIFSNDDGQLLPTLAIRNEVIRLIRGFAPDLVLTHRPNDYHPDHRYTSQLVQDAAYMVTVPAIVPDVPHLPRDPVIAYMPDDFQKPYPFTPDVAVDVGPVVDKIVAMLDCHESQFYEWLPFNGKFAGNVPANADERRNWLAESVRSRLRKQAQRCRHLLIGQYGAARGETVEFAEAFEACEYGSPFDVTAAQRLFPFTHG